MISLTTGHLKHLSTCSPVFVVWICWFLGLTPLKWHPNGHSTAYPGDIEWWAALIGHPLYWWKSYQSILVICSTVVPVILCLWCGLYGVVCPTTVKDKPTPRFWRNPVPLDAGKYSIFLPCIIWVNWNHFCFFHNTTVPVHQCLSCGFVGFWAWPH